MRLALSVRAADQVRHSSPGDTWFFVCSTHRPDAVVLAAFADLTDARAHRRLWQCGGKWPRDSEPCVRVGRVRDGEAHTI